MFIAADKEKRELRLQQQKAWDTLIKRISDGRIEEADYPQLVDVEQLACGERENSRILKAVGIHETKEAAHALLIETRILATRVQPLAASHGGHHE